MYLSHIFILICDKGCFWWNQFQWKSSISNDLQYDNIVEAMRKLRPFFKLFDTPFLSILISRFNFESCFWGKKSSCISLFISVQLPSSIKMFKTLRVLTSLILFIFVLYPDGCAMLQIQNFSKLPRSGYFGNAGKLQYKHFEVILKLSNYPRCHMKFYSFIKPNICREQCDKIQSTTRIWNLNESFQKKHFEI